MLRFCKTLKYWLYLFDLSWVNNKDNIIDGDACLSNVSGKNLKWKDYFDTEYIQANHIL